MERINKIFMTILVVSLIDFANLYCTIAAQADEPGVNVEDEQITQVLNNLFDALRSGNTGTLKRLFAGEMYAKNKTLLEQNAEYPDFLRNYYQGAIFTITEITPSGDDVLAGFTVLSANGRMQTIHMLLTKQDEPKKWFIIKQVQDR